MKEEFYRLYVILDKENAALLVNRILTDHKSD